MQSRIVWLLLFAGIVAAGAIIGLALVEETPNGGSEVGMKKFGSTDELKNYLKAHRADTLPGYYRSGVPVVGAADTKELKAEGGGIGSTTALPLVSATEYSQTNVQVKGVDEADFVKNDGNYIYLVSDRALVIVDAYPAKTARIVSTTPLPGSPTEIFLNGDRLVVFSNGNNEILVKPAGSVAPVPSWRQATKALVYDISDRSSPELARTISMTGSYYESRMIGDFVYTITTEPVDYFLDDPVIPVVKTAGSAEFTPDVYYFDMPYPSYLYQTITSFNVKNEAPPSAESFLVGPASTLYSSPSSLYIAYQKNIPGQRWNEIRPSLPDQGVLPEYSQDGTIIHKFAIANGKVRYEATGDIPGYLLNQFSMDEYGGNLRVATTIEGWTPQRSYQFNNVYVLDDTMQVVGKREYIAPDERIYSTRFIGDRLYMVTFKRIDPFFVIDLSDPKHPGILGLLKLPGYSDYLHPYDDHYIIGIGRETAGNQWGGVSTQGLKLALFDVTDVNNPSLIDEVVIGAAGTDSEALRDHKAFLFDRSKNLVVIPVEEIRNIPLSREMMAPYTLEYWNGAFVFGVTPDNGFALKGRVPHDTGADRFYGTGRVTRSLFIGDVLSTISSSKVVLSDLNDPGTLLTTIPLPSPVYRWNYPVME